MKKRKSNFLILLAKEIYLNYLISPLGFIFAILFSSISVWLFIQDLFLINQASLNPFFSLMPFLFLFFLPAITMSLFAEEKKSKTWEILLTLPTSEKEIVLAKFLAALIFAALSVLLTLPLAIIVSYLGDPDWDVVISGYLGVVLMAASYISTGIFFSSLTRSSIVSFLTTIFFLLINFLIGQGMIIEKLPPLLAGIVSDLSLGYHFNFLIKGNILLSSLVFFFSWIFVFLWLTIVSLKSRDY